MAGGIGTDGLRLVGLMERVGEAALISLSPPRGGLGGIGGRLRGRNPKGPSGGQTKSGASRSGLGVEGLVGGEHVPDRFGQLSGEVDLGDAGAALFAQALFVALVALAVGGVPEGVHGCFEHRPAQVSGTLFGQGAAAV